MIFKNDISRQPLRNLLKCRPLDFAPKILIQGSRTISRICIIRESGLGLEHFLGSRHISEAHLGKLYHTNGTWSRDWRGISGLRANTAFAEFSSQHLHSAVPNCLEP